MDKPTFETTIYRNWAAHFGQPQELIGQPGTTLIPEEKYRGEGEIALWYVGQRTCVQFDPDLAEILLRALIHFPTEQSLKADALVPLLGEKRIKEREKGLSLHLYPEDLPVSALPAPYVIRPLTLADAGALLVLKGFLTSAEVDEGFVEVEHQIAFGCFAGANMVAAASGYEVTGFMDLGVLTHAAHRRKGLGKAVVGALCVWVNENGYIAQYRHDATNTGSAHLAQSLNFKVYAEEETLWLI